MLAAAHVKW